MTQPFDPYHSSGGGPVPAPPGSGRADRPTLLGGATVHGLTGERGIRHPWDVPLFIVGTVLTGVVYLGWIIGIIVVIVGLSSGWRLNLLPLTLSPLGSFVIQIVLFAPIAVWILRALQYAQMRSNAVRMSPTQFPEGYRIVAEAAREFGLRRVPDAYVVLGNGMINAFAAGHGFRRYVAVYSDMFEIGGRVRDPDALRFVIAHEVGHLAAGHVGYFRLLFANLLMNVPLLGSAYSRAQEYSADNFGYRFCPQGAPGTMAVLGAGKYLNADVNVHELADRGATEKGLWVHIANWMSTHPVLTWRTAALRDRSHAGHLWFRPGLLTASRDWYQTALPSGDTGSENYPTPDEALGLLARADGIRPVDSREQFGRFPGVDYAGRRSIREEQISPPLI